MDRLTPLGALLTGVAAGLTGTLALSALSRIMPSMQFGRPNPLESRPEEDESDANLVVRATPAQALTEPQSPGPEGLAQQFAFKMASGLFGRDISQSARLWGLAVHLLYGAAWGAAIGVLLGTFSWPAPWAGLVFGLFVWFVGPVLLVPAMRILPPLPRQGAPRIAILVAGHLAWGAVVAYTFRFLEGRLV